MTVISTPRGPRFEYLCGDDPDARRRTGHARYGWRLAAANNRPLGRAFALTDSLDACTDAAHLLRTSLSGLDISITLDAARSTWAWRAELQALPVAVSAHSYLRRPECARALAQFRDAVARAAPADGVVRYFGPRSLAAFAAVPDGLTTSQGTQ